MRGDVEELQHLRDAEHDRVFAEESVVVEPDDVVDVDVVAEVLVADVFERSVRGTADPRHGTAESGVQIVRSEYRAVTEFVARGLLEPHLKRISAAHGARRDTMLAALERHLSDVARWSKPDGGVFVWVSLPENLDTSEMFHRAIEKQVAYIPGGVFSVDGSTKNALRLNFSNVTPEAIEEGMARLAEVIRTALHE